MSLFENQIPLLRPWMGEEEAQAAREVILSGWVSQGPVVAKFERAVADFVGAVHGVATSSATSALHLSLLVSGVTPGDEVICPAHTCMATVNAICQAGADVVFCEIEPDTFNLDPQHVATLITERTRAIMVVHQIGLPADLDALTQLAARRGIKIIEDAATSLGATYHGKYLGASGNPVVYSFHPRKMITTGEGGMMMTASSEQAERARILRATGASISDLVRHQAKGVLQQVYYEAGFNYRLTDIQAAIGLVQMTRLPEMIRQRARQGAYYNQQLGAMDEVQPPCVPPDRTHAYTSYCIRIRPGARRSRDEVLDSMAKQGVSCRRGIPPLYAEPYFRPRMPDLFFPVSEEAARNTMFLPIFPGLTQGDQERVAEALKQALR